jgi:uncharacterized membrane protein YfcA
LPFQVSALGFTSPAVSPTNLVYNILATPGGVYRYVSEGRVVWPPAWTVILGTLPDVFVGAILGVTLLSDPDAFEVFVGLVLLYFGARLLYEVARPKEGAGALLRAGRERCGSRALPCAGSSTATAARPTLSAS